MQLRYVLPIAIFAGIAVMFAVGLRMDPSRLPSALVGKPVPAFDLPPIAGRTDGAKPGLASDDLRGQVSLVNVFASWCIPCQAEHPILMRISADGVVALYGINYKDKPKDAIRWLERLGDPYERIGADLDGRVGIDWGVYGVPETYVVDGEGMIRRRHAGPITREDLDEMLDLIEELQQ